MRIEPHGAFKVADRFARAFGPAKDLSDGGKRIGVVGDERHGLLNVTLGLRRPALMIVDLSEQHMGIRGIGVKRDGTRVPFDPQNILKGVHAACGKRPIPEDAKLRLAEEVEDELGREFDREVASSVIGQRVMHKLRAIDRVAYIRFASEYFQFELGELREEVEELHNRGPEVRDQGGLFTEGS